ncbi:hypothetical protein VNO77_19680 [Canavalia gladiata]|uniref:Uncharacterized protein n=1 Tax=Canavalia gladiata TaxID=3824 RepID=A0AAN9LT12_CANGL
MVSMRSFLRQQTSSRVLISWHVSFELSSSGIVVQSGFASSYLECVESLCCIDPTGHDRDAGTLIIWADYPVLSSNHKDTSYACMQRSVGWHRVSTRRRMAKKWD